MNAVCLYSLPLLATGICVGILAGRVWKRRAVPAAAPLLGLLIAIVCWCIPCAFEPFASDPRARLHWMQIELPAITLVPFWYLLVTLQFTGVSLRTRGRLILCSIPAAAQVIGWTNDWHHLYWRRVWIEHSGPLALTGYDYGPCFWPLLVYAWVCAALSQGLLVRRLFRTEGPQRTETLIFWAATTPPILFNVVDALHWLPESYPDLTPFAFSLTGAGMAWVLFRYRFQAIVPVAWKTVIESLADAVVVLDRESRVLATNVAAGQLLNRREDQIIGRHVNDAFAGFPALQDFANGAVADGDVVLSPGFAMERIFEVRVSPVRDSMGRSLGRSLTLHDVTARRAVSRELARAKQAADDANRSKSEFLANMSHEIRTPMNGVLGMAEALLETALTGDQRSDLLILRSSAASLLAIINDILDFSKIDAGKLNLESIAFDLRDRLHEIVRPLEFGAAQKALTLSLKLGDDVPDVVCGDPLRLGQILTNLIANAIKFTDHGEVSLSVAGDSYENESVNLHFIVADTGIGIPAEKQQAIFSAFNQADASTTRQYGGTGLGLSISSRLVALMGGRIWVESEIGKGSRFHFTIRFTKPCGRSEEPELQIAESAGAPQSTIRVLVAEDNPVNQRVATRLLEKRGCSVTIADNGRKALSAIRRAKFDLILMDLQMPEMDGLEATSAIRRQELLTGRRHVIIALTANAMSGDKEKCLEAGMDGYLAKPIRPAELSAVLNKFAQRDRPELVIN